VPLPCEAGTYALTTGILATSTTEFRNEDLIRYIIRDQSFPLIGGCHCFFSKVLEMKYVKLGPFSAHGV
jgi:hypothetical protein